MNNLPTIIVSGLFLACGGAMGADSDEELPSEKIYLSDFPTVLSVTRLAQPKSETPAAITVIDRDMIRASGARKIPDLFRLVPGFMVGYDHGFRPIVTYHGLSDEFSRRMQVLVDGRSVYGVFIGGVFWNDLPLDIEDISRIEIIRGPNTAAYGSNSFFAVINIITLHASEARGTSLKFAAGEHRVRDGFARHGWDTADGSARLSLAYRQDDGFDGLPDSERVPVVAFRGDFRAGPVDTLEVQLGVNGDSFRKGHDSSNTGPPRDADVTSHFQQLRWRRSLGVEEEWSLQFFHNYWKSDEDYLTAPLNLSALGLGTAQIPISLDATEDRYDLEFQHVSSPLSDWRLVWGLGARLDQARSRAYLGSDDAVKNRIYRLFGNAEWRARPDTVVNLGTMLEKNGLGGADLSPRLALNHHFTPDNTLRLSASKATRAPTLVEEKGDSKFYYQGVFLEQDILPLGGLKPETMKSYELGFLSRVPEWHISWDVRVYRDRIRNLITELIVPVVSLDGRALAYRNEGEVDITGKEIQIDFRPRRDTRFVFSYAGMKAAARGLSGEANFDAKEHERSVPVFSGSLLVMHRFLGIWEGSLAYYRVSDVDWLGGGDFNEGHGRLDARIARDLRLGRARGQMALVVQNWGPKYIDFESDQVFDRRAFVTFSLRP